MVCLSVVDTPTPFPQNTRTFTPNTGYAAQRSSHGGSAGGGGDSQGSLPQQRLLAERKWRLGLAVRGHPSALMAELYRVLQVGCLRLRGWFVGLVFWWVGWVWLVGGLGTVRPQAEPFQGVAGGFWLCGDFLTV